MQCRVLQNIGRHIQKLTSSYMVVDYPYLKCYDCQNGAILPMSAISRKNNLIVYLY